MKSHLLVIGLVFILTSCSPNFLEEKPNSNILSPKRVADFQRLLDNFDIMGVTSALPQLSADEYFIDSHADWQSSITEIEKNSYIWDTDVFGDAVNIDDWNMPYQSIFYSNNIINEIDKILEKIDPSSEFSDVYGQALFQRAKVYFDLVKNFSVPFDAETQNTDLGVPLRLEPSIDYTVARATVEECYAQIFRDLEQALKYLKFTGPLPERNRATRLATFALLSRIHLYRREYKKAERYADSVLNRYNKLIDYNTLSTTSSAPFSINNDELIMYGRTNNSYSYASIYNTSNTVFIDTNLLKAYEDDDLRLKLFFNNVSGDRFIMKGGYNGSGLTPFNGFAVNEVLLTKTECLARKSELKEAADCLNYLLANRYKAGKFDPLNFHSSDEALSTILEERRKELVWRALRWDDIKRLNKEGANIRLVRRLDGQEFVLEPNSLKYTFNIPQDEINRSEIIQNIR